MYLSFFGLNEKPFAITPDPRYLYLSERHAEALAHLMYGINEAGGFVQLTGEVGTGKTTIVRSLLAQAPKNAEIALILNPRMTPPEFLLTICEELGIGVPDSAAGSLKDLVDILSDYLLRSHGAGKRVVLVVDEAQNLSPEVLEELRLLVNASHEAGAVEESEAKIAARAFTFADLSAGELMTPRAAVHALAVDLPVEEVLERARAAGHSRLPLYQGSLDDVIGIVHVTALLGLDRRSQPGPDLRALAEKPTFIPLSRGADDVLEDLRRGGVELAVVLDEYGVTAGILTLHDIMEGLVGRIGEDGGRGIGTLLPDGSRVFDGLVRLGELEEVTGLRVPEEERQQADTLNGLVMVRLGRVPRAGDTIELGGHRLVVESMAHKRIGRARLSPRAAS
jgi:Mg2+/Co2+ transporter CorB